MGREIEAKYRLDAPQPMRARLQECGARPLGSVLETSRIFDTPQRTLLVADCGLRLRSSQPLQATSAPCATLTYKGPRARGAPKMREEIETAVGDAQAAGEILRRLGFGEVIVYQKRRESWQLGAAVVCLDELPRLGWFVEVEAPDVGALQAAVRRLGLTTQPPLAETYVELVARRGESGQDGAARLVFGE